MIKTALGAQRYNNRMDKIFENAKRLNERNDFIKFLGANPDLTLDESIKLFKSLKDIPL